MNFSTKIKLRNGLPGACENVGLPSSESTFEESNLCTRRVGNEHGFASENHERPGNGIGQSPGAAFIFESSLKRLPWDKGCPRSKIKTPSFELVICGLAVLR